MPIPQLDVPDIAGNYLRGMQAKAFTDQQEQQNALAGALQQYGAAASQGDQNALAQLARYDPQMVSGLMGDQQQMDLRGRADARASTESQHGMANDDARLAMARQQSAAAMEEHAAQMDEAQRKKAAEQADKVAGAATAIGSAEEWDRYFGGDPATEKMVGHFGDKDIIIAQARGVTDVLGGASKPASVQEFEYGQANPEYNEWREGQREGSKSYGTLYYSQGPDGQIHAFQAGSDGTPREVQLPDGQKVLPPTRAVDLGTSSQTQTVAGGVPLANTPIDVAGKSAEQATGTTVGNVVGGAKVQLPAAKLSFDEASGLISDIANSPALEGITGKFEGSKWRPDWSKSQGGIDLEQKITQLTGKTFLDVRQLLKGAGAVTDFEGQKGEEAVARLNRAQSRDAYLSALNDLQTHMQRGLQLMEMIANGQIDENGKLLDGGSANGGAGDMSDEDMFSKYGVQP